MSGGDDRAIDLERALLDPAEVFDRPEAVLAQPGLADTQKIDILRRWEYDLLEQGVAAEEGMPGEGGNELLTRVLDALRSLGATGEAGPAAPTKHRGG